MLRGLALVAAATAAAGQSCTSADAVCKAGTMVYPPCCDGTACLWVAQVGAHCDDAHCKWLCKVPPPTTPAPAPTPPAPPGARYHCDSAVGKCIEGETGHHSMQQCVDACAPLSPLPAECGGAVINWGDDCRTDPKGPDCCPFGADRKQTKCFEKSQYFAGCNSTCDPTVVDPYDNVKWSCKCLSSPAQCAGTTPAPPAPSPFPAKCGGAPIKWGDDCRADPKGPDCCPLGAGQKQQTCYEKSQYWAGCLDTGSCDPTTVDPYDGVMWTCKCLSSDCPTPPAPAPPGPAPAGCPAGSLSACIGLCPASPAAAYKACVTNCVSHCPGARAV